jgi:GR25 family glycosyltransferase involved in LPS biosynthesis
MKLPFDKIYCLHLVDAKERYKSVLEECNKINLENKVDFWYTTKKPINITIGNNIQSLHDNYYDSFFKNGNEYVYGACFDCAYNHYSIIKQAYMRGLNSILIIEDDICFNDDLRLLNNIINNIPYDYDVLKLYNLEIPYKNESSIKPYKNESFIKPYFLLLNEHNYKYYYRSTLCYALNRKGMEALINEYETNLVAADIALDNVRFNEDIKFYTLRKNLFCTFKKLISTITNK